MIRMNSKTTILIIVITFSIIFTRCGFFNNSSMDSKESLLEIYTYSRHTEESSAQKVFNKYGLNTKEKWREYHDKLIEFVINNKAEDFTQFRKDAVDKYIAERDKNYEIKIYETKSYNMNFRPNKTTKEISEENIKDYKNAFKIYQKKDHEDHTQILKLEYYIDGELKRILYKNNKNVAVKEEIIEDGELHSVSYPQIK